jgi:hypothetical protein
MKAEADIHFLQGINQLVGHGWPYSPPQAGEPGWHLYAAAVFNQHNPWWIVMPDIAAYLQRVSWLLRQGEPATDVALYLPTADAYAGFSLGHDSVSESMDRLLGPNAIPQILEGGYNYDFIDDDAIAAVGIKYPILILPNVERIPLKTLKTIAEYARLGGIVISTGRVPSLAPGFLETKTDTPQIFELARISFRTTFSRGHLVRDDTQLAETLHKLLPPDVTAPPEIGFVHRSMAPYEAYFFVNTGNHPVTCSAGSEVHQKRGACVVGSVHRRRRRRDAGLPHPVTMKSTWTGPIRIAGRLVFPGHSLEAGRKIEPFGGGSV